MVWYKLYYTEGRCDSSFRAGLTTDPDLGGKVSSFLSCVLEV